MNKKIFLEYFRTFFFTVIGTALIVLLILLSMFWNFSNESRLSQNVDDNALTPEMLNILIEKNKYLDSKQPGNYKINLKLGMLYEEAKEYKLAENEYDKSINEAPYEEFKPYYKKSLLYIKLGRLADAEEVMDDIGEKPIKKLIKYKGEIYFLLGDAYYNGGDYFNAAIKYQKSLNYYKVIKQEEPQKLLRRNIASAYIYLADEKVDEMKPDEAISYIKIAKSIVDAPILTYKLGLLLIESDPKQACKYFDEVYEKEPSLINYEVYYELLSLLASEASYNDEDAQSELYNLRIRKIKNYYNKNLLQITDVAIGNISGNITIHRLLRRYRVIAEVSLHNISNYTINSLFFEVVFKDGDEVIERFHKQIINENSPLKSGEFIPVIDVKTKTIRINQDFPKEITVQIYASKKEDSYRLLLKEFKIVRKDAPRHINPIERFFLKYFYPYIGF